MLTEQDNRGRGIGESPICRGCSSNVRNLPDGSALIIKEIDNWFDYSGNWDPAYPCLAARMDDSRGPSLPVILKTNGAEKCSRYSPTMAQTARDLTAALGRIVRVETGEAEKVTLSRPYRKEISLPDFKGYSITVSPDALQSKRQLVILGRIRIGLPSIIRAA